MVAGTDIYYIDLVECIYFPDGRFSVDAVYLRAILIRKWGKPPIPVWLLSGKTDSANQKFDRYFTV
jgi:hypothetical protein